MATMKTEFVIALHPNPKPFAISCSCSVPIPPDVVRQEIQRVDDIVVNKRVEHATQWCAAVMIDKKKYILPYIFALTSPSLTARLRVSVS